MAIKVAKVYSEERIPLNTVIPREVPFSVEIDVASVCNLKCNFCFHSDIDSIKKSGVKFGIMEMELFKKLIDDLSEFPYKPTKLKLFEFGEPLMNKKIGEMIRYAREKDVAGSIETVSNGVLLTRKLSLELVESGLNRINISVESLSSDGYYEIAGKRIDFDEYVDNIKFLYENKGNCFIYIKLIDVGNLSSQDRELFYRTFEDICDEIFIENAVPIWNGTTALYKSDNLVGAYGQDITEKIVCPLIFTRMIVNYDGIVSLCCADWKRECAIGDAKTQSLYTIWNGNILREYQKTHLKGERNSIQLCNGCTTLSTSTIDNVDDYRKEILDKMNR